MVNLYYFIVCRVVYINIWSIPIQPEIKVSSRCSSSYLQCTSSNSWNSNNIIIPYSRSRSPTVSLNQNNCTSAHNKWCRSRSNTKTCRSSCSICNGCNRYDSSRLVIINPPTSKIESSSNIYRSPFNYVYRIGSTP